MIRIGLTFVRRVVFAAFMLVLLACGAEVAVRTYEAASGGKVCYSNDGVCGDPSRLTIPSWSFHQELRPMAEAKVECRDTHSEVEVRTNSLGLRGSEIVIPKPRGTCRVIVLGDETIFAPETPVDEHFCTLLRERLQQNSNQTIEVVNAGIPGHCPLTEFLIFKQRLLSLQPDLVLLHFDWSDVSDDRQIRRRAVCDDEEIPQACPHLKLISSKNVRPQEVWRQQFRLFDWGLTALSFEWKQQIDRQKAISRDADTNPYAWLREERPGKNISFRNSVRPIEDMARLCRSVNVPFVLITSPKPWQVSEKCSCGEGVRLAAGVSQNAVFSNRAPFDVLARFADLSNIPFVDGSIVIAPGRDAESNFLRYAPRWSSAGHLRMAELVAPFIFDHIQGPWNRPYATPNEQPVSHEMPQERKIQWTSGQRSNPDRVVQDPGRQVR